MKQNKAAKSSHGPKLGSKHISEKDRAIIVGMRHAGMSYRIISSNTGVATTTVQNIWAKFVETSSCSRRKGSGRPRKTNDKDDHNIVLSIKRDRETTSAEVAHHFYKKNISPQLIRRRIAEQTDMKSSWKIRKPFVSARNREARVR